MADDTDDTGLATAFISGSAQDPQVIRSLKSDAKARADDEERKREFVQKIMEARMPKPVPAPQPVAPQISEQTRLEMEAGAARVKYYQDQEAKRPKQPKVDPSEGSMTPVFRPEDWVPNFNQGKNGARQV